MKTAETVVLEAIYKSMDAELERQNRFLGTHIKSTRPLTVEA